MKRSRLFGAVAAFVLGLLGSGSVAWADHAVYFPVQSYSAICSSSGNVLSDPVCPAPTPRHPSRRYVLADYPLSGSCTTHADPTSCTWFDGNTGMVWDGEIDQAWLEDRYLSQPSGDAGGSDWVPNENYDKWTGTPDNVADYLAQFDTGLAETSFAELPAGDTTTKTLMTGSASYVLDSLPVSAFTLNTWHPLFYAQGSNNRLAVEARMTSTNACAGSLPRFDYRIFYGNSGTPRFNGQTITNICSARPGGDLQPHHVGIRWQQNPSNSGEVLVELYVDGSYIGDRSLLLKQNPSNGPMGTTSALSGNLWCAKAQDAATSWSSFPTCYGFIASTSYWTPATFANQAAVARGGTIVWQYVPPESPEASPSPGPTATTTPSPTMVPPPTSAPAPSPPTTTVPNTSNETHQTGLLERIGGLVDNLIGTTRDMFSWLGTHLTGLFQWLGGLLETLFFTLQDYMRRLLDHLIAWLSSVLNFIIDLLADIRAALAAGFEVLRGWLESIWNLLAQLLGDVAGLLSSVLEAVLALPGFLLQLPRMIADLLRGVLEDLFVPDLDFAPLEDACTTSFPCSWVGEAVETVGAIADEATGGTACGPSIGFSHELVPDGYRVHFPNPSGCPSNGDGNDEAFDLFGYREPLRAVFSLFLWIGFIALMVRQLPWSRGDVPGEAIP